MPTGRAGISKIPSRFVATVRSTRVARLRTTIPAPATTRSAGSVTRPVTVLSESAEMNRTTHTSKALTHQILQLDEPAHLRCRIGTTLDDRMLAGVLEIQNFFGESGEGLASLLRWMPSSLKSGV